MNLLIFSIGAAIGAPIRFWMENKFRSKYKFPIGILIVNLIGSFLIGLYAHEINYFVVGFCGALTTWSTFIVDLYLGVRNRSYKSVALNLAFSLILGVLAFKTGFSISKA